MGMNFYMSLRRKFFFSHFFAILLISGSVGVYFYTSAMNNLMSQLRASLMKSAAIVSVMVDARSLDEITTRKDVELPAYQDCLRKLRALRKTNRDIAYLYIMRREGERVFFVVDSDDSTNQALPGREYEKKPKELLEGFVRPSADKKITTDEWGSFLSGYAPLKNGGGKYLVGLDMRSDEVRFKMRQIRLAAVIPFVGSLFLALVFSRILSDRQTTPIQMIISRCRSIAAGRLDEKVDIRTNDEFDGLIQAFNIMSERLAESREHNRNYQRSLEQIKNELEIRVQERTSELNELNNQLVQEIDVRKKAENSLAEAARTDSLTGIFNRRAIWEQLEYHIVLFRRYQTPFTLLMCDLDHFKPVNDTYGHDIGDIVLVKTAEKLRESCRNQDFVSRWGGEEFLILLPNTDIQGGAIAAEKIRQKISEQPFEINDQKLVITVSIGIAAYVEGLSIDDCIKQADSAMYQAKREGRNRVAVSSD